jgi:hypothetical protein
MPYVAVMMTNPKQPETVTAIPVRSWDYTELNRIADVRTMLRSVSGLPDSWLPLSTTSENPANVKK